MRVYISTPVNGRKEKTFEEKYAAAEERCRWVMDDISEREWGRDAVFVHTFALNPPGGVTEAEAMGRCVQAVMESDMVVLDRGLEQSKGCRLERLVASIYNIPVTFMW